MSVVPGTMHVTLEVGNTCNIDDKGFGTFGTKLCKPCQVFSCPTHLQQLFLSALYDKGAKRSDRNVLVVVGGGGGETYSHPFLDVRIKN